MRRKNRALNSEKTHKFACFFPTRAPNEYEELGVSVHFLSAIGYRCYLLLLMFRYGAVYSSFLAEKGRASFCL